jgi:hypothetical protein
MRFAQCSDPASTEEYGDFIGADGGLAIGMLTYRVHIAPQRNWRKGIYI